METLTNVRRIGLGGSKGFAAAAVAGALATLAGCAVQSDPSGSTDVRTNVASASELKPEGTTGGDVTTDSSTGQLVTYCNSYVFAIEFGLNSPMPIWEDLHQVVSQGGQAGSCAQGLISFGCHGIGNSNTTFGSTDLTEVNSSQWTARYAIDCRANTMNSLTLPLNQWTWGTYYGYQGYVWDCSTGTCGSGWFDGTNGWQMHPGGGWWYTGSRQFTGWVWPVATDPGYASYGRPTYSGVCAGGVAAGRVAPSSVNNGCFWVPDSSGDEIDDFDPRCGTMCAN
jgi:hypothetical protein